MEQRRTSDEQWLDGWLARKLADSEERRRSDGHFAEVLKAETERLQTEARAVQGNIDELQSGQAARLWRQVEEEAAPLLTGPPAQSERQVKTRVAPAKYGKYRLEDEDINEALREELRSFHEWMTQPSFSQGHRVVRPVTADRHLRYLRRTLGWLLYVRMPQGGIDHLLADAGSDPARSARSAAARRQAGLRLRSCLPAPDAEGAKYVFEYMQWIRSERGSSPLNEGLCAKCMVKVAKYLYTDEAAASVAFRGGLEGKGGGVDRLGVVRQLRELAADADARARSGSKTLDDSKKMVTWPTFLMCLARLKEEHRAAARDDRRPPRVTAMLLQKLLIFSVLSVFPDRQRTLRELEIGSTLVRRRDGLWAIRHSAADFKTGSVFGERATVLLPKRISSLITSFVSRWRRHLRPGRHRFLFVMPETGKPYHAAGLSSQFQRTIYRLTGKKTNPHLLRDAVVTFMRNRPEVTEETLESLAVLMGHSMDMQVDVYDKSTAEQKLSPALSLMRKAYEQSATQA